MIVLFDTNVILDLLLLRQPFAPAATRLVASVEQGRLSGMLAATSVTTIDYLLAKGLGPARARQETAKLLRLFRIAAVSGLVLEAALGMPFEDFEDAVIHEAARLAGAEGIVTRNAADFRHASLRIYAPDSLVAMLRAAPPPPH